MLIEQWHNVFKMLRENKLEPKILSPCKLSFSNEGTIKTFSHLKDFDSLLLRELIERYTAVGKKKCIKKVRIGYKREEEAEKAGKQC